MYRKPFGQNQIERLLSRMRKGQTGLQGIHVKAPCKLACLFRTVIASGQGGQCRSAGSVAFSCDPGSFVLVDCRDTGSAVERLVWWHEQQQRRKQGRQPPAARQHSPSMVGAEQWAAAGRRAGRKRHKRDHSATSMRIDSQSAGRRHAQLHRWSSKNLRRFQG